MKKIKLFALLAATAFVTAGVATSCGEKVDPSLPKVRVGLHANLGAGAGYSAINQGFFREEGLNVSPQIGKGPALAGALVAGDLDVSFMGNGVAWNYFTSKKEIKLVALDNLTDDDRLIATNTGKGKDLTINSSLAEIGAALKKAKVGFDTTATPAAFWSSLVGEINKAVPDADKIWYEDDSGNKLPTLTTYNENNKVEVVKMDNTSVPQAMQQKQIDFCITFAPGATLLEKDTNNFKVVAKTSTHMSDSYTPSTWAVNAKWLENNKDTFAKFMRGLVKGMNFRNKTPEKTCEDIEIVSAGQVTADTLVTDIAVWLDAKAQLELESSGKMKKYAENIRNSQLNGGNKDAVDPSVTVEQACDFTYLLDACKDLK